MITIAYAKRSSPSAHAIAEHLNNSELVRDSNVPVDINWGRYKANAKLNPDISNVTNKRRMRELFAEHGVPMPRLICGDELLNDYGYNTYPVVGRPDQHTKGRGFWLCHNMSEINRAYRGTRTKKAATHFMEYVEAEREYRVHIFKGKSIRISEKGFTDDSKKEYITRKPGEIKLRNVREAAKQAVAAVGLDFGAVDILARGADNSEVWVLEVNSAPGVGGTMPQVYANAFEQWKEAQ